VLFGRNRESRSREVRCVHPDTGPRAQEFGPSSAQENARQKKGAYRKSARIAIRSRLGPNN
jgi:hypothetical protein